MSRYSTPRKQEAIEKTKEPKVNLWSNLLKESLKHAQIPAGSCVFVGNSLCGKNQLVDKICASPVVAEEEEDLSKEVVSYDHFEVEEGLETNINIWSFGEEIFDNASEILKHSHKTDKMMVMIALDLSKPGDCVAALKNWLPRISRYIRSYHESIDSQQSKAIKAALSEYLSTARLNKGEVVNLASSEQKDGATTESLDFSVDQYDFILENFGLPIIVVGCKLDMMTPEQGTPAKFAREVQGAIRSICLDIGAALIYTSAMEDLNCIELRKYMLHRFYPDKIAADLSIQDSNDMLFIPSGFDTVDLINIATGIQNPSAGSYKKHFDPNAAFVVNTSKKVEKKEEPVNDLDYEQDWLTGLYTFISQVASSGNDPQRPVRAASSTGDLDSQAPVARSETAANSSSPTNSTGEGSRPGLATQKTAKSELRRSATSARTPSDKKDVSNFFKGLLK